MSYGEESADEGEEDYYANDEFVYEDADVDQSSQDPETKFIKELIENEKNNQGAKAQRLTDRSAKLGH